MKRVFTCKRDGMVISGVEYRAENHEEMPIVIISHGFMANMNMCKKYARFFSKKGYAAYIFDFNGGGPRSKSSGSTIDMSVLTEVEDLKSVIEYATSLSYTDSSKITLMGCSQGGFVSAIAAARLRDKIERLILFYPALCIPDDARKGKMMFAEFDPHSVPDIIECGPMKLGKCYPLAVMNMDPFAEISGYAGPVLIVHGDKDKIVDYHYAQKACQFYADAKLVLLKGAGHMFLGLKDKQALAAVNLFVKGTEL